MFPRNFRPDALKKSLRKGGIAVINEIRTGLKKTSFRIMLLLFFLLGLYCIYLTKNNLQLLQELGDVSVLEQASFPPVTDAFLLFTLLTGATLFTVRGYMDLYSDRRLGIFRQRYLLLGSRTYMIWKMASLLMEISLDFLLILGMSIPFQQMITHAVPAQTWQQSSLPVLLSALGKKYFAGLCVLVESYLCGTIIALFIRRPIPGLLLCLGADQFLLSSGPLYTVGLYKAFRSASFIVSVPEETGFPLSSPPALILLGGGCMVLTAALSAVLISYSKRISV